MSKKLQVHTVEIINTDIYIYKMERKYFSRHFSAHFWFIVPRKPLCIYTKNVSERGETSQEKSRFFPEKSEFLSETARAQCT